jgi:hypothetical protein
MWDLKYLNATAITLDFHMKMKFVPHKKHIRPSSALYGGGLTFFYVDDVRTSQETHVWNSTAS